MATRSSSKSNTTTKSDPKSKPKSRRKVDGGALLGELDQAREEAAALIEERERKAVEAEQQRETAEALASRLRDLESRLGETDKALEEARAQIQNRERTLAEARRKLESREQALEQERAEAQTREKELEIARADIATREEREAEQRARADQLERKLLQLQRLYLVRRMHREDIFERIVKLSTEIVGAEKGVYLEANGNLNVRARQNFEKARADSVLLKEVARQVVERQEVLAFNNQIEIASVSNDPISKTVRNMAAFPIAIKERFAGVVIVANKEGAFTEQEARLLLGIGNHAGIAIENRRLRRDLEDAYAGTMSLLCDAIEAKDAHTRGHCEEVAGFALAVARELGMNEDDQETVFQGGLLHDIGKIAISDGILLKPGPLAPAEREVIETHTKIGAELLENVPQLRDFIPAVLYHHERYDGRGYPNKLSADEIPIHARVICVADSYSTMLSNRPYRGALNPDQARAELNHGAGGQFDPEIVRIFLNLLDAPDKLQQVWSDMYNRPHQFMSA